MIQQLDPITLTLDFVPGKASVRVMLSARFLESDILRIALSYLLLF